LLLFLLRSAATATPTVFVFAVAFAFLVVIPLSGAEWGICFCLKGTGFSPSVRGYKT